MFLGGIGEADIPLFGKNNLNCEKTGLQLQDNLDLLTNFELKRITNYAYYVN